MTCARVCPNTCTSPFVIADSGNPDMVLQISCRVSAIRYPLNVFVIVKTSVAILRAAGERLNSASITPVASSASHCGLPCMASHNNLPITPPRVGSILESDCSGSSGTAVYGSSIFTSALWFFFLSLCRFAVSR